jgi:hypothetical protein
MQTRSVNASVFDNESCSTPFSTRCRHWHYAPLYSALANLLPYSSFWNFLNLATYFEKSEETLFR